MLEKLIKNHVLTNLVFGLVLVLGFLYIYPSFPREQDPSINFNWVQITTILPGASSRDVERKVTNILEDSLQTLQDIYFVSSTSRENVSSILVRFRDVGEEEFDKRMVDLRREVQNVESQLPIEVERSFIYEINSANGFPTATVMVHGPADDENLRRHARTLETDLKRIPGVDRVNPTGYHDPEIQIQFDIEKIEALNLSPVAIADSIRSFYVDVSAGTARVAEDEWIISVQGTTVDPDELAQLPVLSNQGVLTEWRLGDVAKVVTARAKADRIVRYNGEAAVLFDITKLENVNTLALVETISAFVDERNRFSEQLGVKFTLADDQTLQTREALNIMQNNALYGLIFVLIIIWVLLGSRISLLVSIGIPFTLAGTFIVLYALNQTLNTSVLLAIVISLGMLVDDAVVVVESIHDKLRTGVSSQRAVFDGLREVMSPVTASVMTTMAAFLPLMLMPGILGDFMMVIPLVVTIALAISLVEAYWMLPGHMLASNVNFDKPSKTHLLREKIVHKFKIRYGQALIKVMRNPKKSLLVVVFLLLSSLGAVAAGLVRIDFFASDSLRIFYVSVEMPSSSSLDETMDKVLEVEAVIKAGLEEGEARAVVSYAGQQRTELEMLMSQNLGQILVSLNPRVDEMRDVQEVMDNLNEPIQNVIGPVEVSFMGIDGGIPEGAPVSVKVRGDDYDELREATDALTEFLVSDGRFYDIIDDDSNGRYGLNLKLDLDAINRLGINPSDIYRTVKMMVDGEIVNFIQHENERVALRVKSSAAVENDFEDIQTLLSMTVPTATGQVVPIRQLLVAKTEQVKSSLRHYNFLRAITLESEIDTDLLNTVSANDLLREHWETISADYPNVNLDFTGSLDDVLESIDSLFTLLLMGVAIMYIILSTQFQSYFQPLMILASVPLAFTGVVAGLLVSNNPLSLFSLYGIVALAGIAVNAAIVLISKANTNLYSGMSLLHATFYAARRRMLPILITTLTTIGGLFSLAVGLGGKSLMWSPVATAIVWGLIFSSSLTLFIVPVIYQISMKKAAGKIRLGLLDKK